jgi:hypothetical protein
VSGSRTRRAAIAGLLATMTVALAGTAHASLVARLDADALRAGADTVVDGRVIDVTSDWNADRTGFETRVRFAVDRVVHGAPAFAEPAAAVSQPIVEVVVPGGRVGGDQQIIVGMPGFTPGERARLHLRAHRGAYRVYGWAQGKWPGYELAGITVYLPPEVAHSTGAATGRSSFTHNGLVWPPEQIPVEYLIHAAGSDDVAFADAQAAVFAAFDTWQDVPCSGLQYSFAGTTDLGVAVDDVNVVLWIEQGWIYGEEAAGATALFFPEGSPPTADVALNGEHFGWATGVPGVGPATQDIQGVMTHELGHFSGLSHTMSSLDTMYFSWTPWQSQRSLSADDKLGLCALYERAGDECATAADCDPGATCETYARGTLCTPQPDPLGAPCNYDRVECQGFCLFTALNLSSGYCSQFCDGESPCPSGFACRPASAGGTPVMVCFADESAGGDPDAGPDPGCADDTQCPATQFCGPDAQCTYECLIDIDCADRLVCGERGHCVTDPGTGGGGCAASRGAAPWFALLALLWLAATTRRRHGLCRTRRRAL